MSLFNLDPILHKNIIQYKNSKCNIVPVNMKWLTNAGTSWSDYIESKSNMLYISILELENPYHLLPIIRRIKKNLQGKIIYPCKVFAYCHPNGNGLEICKRIFTYHYHPWYSLEIHDEAQLDFLLRLWL